MTLRTRAFFAQYLRQRKDLGESEIVLDPATLEVLFALDRLERAGSGQSSAPGVGNDSAVQVARSHPALEAPSTRSLPVVTPLPGSAGDETLLELARVASTCTACGLAATRSTVVFGEGSVTAKLVVVGEAPGAEEDRTGRPFVGRAGKLLDSLLASIGYPRESVYICNVLKCRPPGNRNPAPGEVESCSPFLRRQLELIAPKAILACGTFPAQTLLGTTEPIGRLRGSVHEYAGIPFVPTYHPAALLRNPGWIRPVWEDLQRLRAALDR